MSTFWIQNFCLGLGCIVLSWLFWDEASGKGRLVKKPYRHSHSHAKSDEKEKEEGHGHEHGHAHKHSPFGFTLGVTYSAVQSGESEEGGDHSGHGHLANTRGLNLHGGDDHGAEEGGETSPEAVFTAAAKYNLTEWLATGVGFGYGFTTGLRDPTGSINTTAKFSKSTSFGTSFSASAPITEASQESYKITTLTLGGGPSFRIKKFTLGLRGSIAKSYYSKTIIVEEMVRKGYSLDEDHDHDHDDDEADHDIGDEGTGDREFDRYTGGPSIGYRLTKSWQLGMNGSVSYVTKQFGEPSVETTVTPAQVTYSFASMAASAAYLLSGSGESFTAPTNSGFSVGISYTYE